MHIGTILYHNIMRFYAFIDEVIIYDLLVLLGSAENSYCYQYVEQSDSEHIYNPKIEGIKINLNKDKTIIITSTQVHSEKITQHDVVNRCSSDDRIV